MNNFNFDAIKKKKLDTNIIAEGEVTGHKHVLENGRFEVYKNLEDECLLLKILNKSKIKHEEHKEIELLPNNYRQRTVKEYDHLKEEARKVVD